MSKRREEIPEEFDSLEEEAEFWENFNTSDIWDELEDADDFEFEQPEKQVVSFRISKSRLEEIKKYAKALETPYTVLMRLWVVRSFQQEAQSARAKYSENKEDYYTPWRLARPTSNIAHQQLASNFRQEVSDTGINLTPEGATEVNTKALKPNKGEY